MAFFSFLYRNGLWISIPILAGAIALLVVCIRGVVAMGGQSRIHSLPLVPEQPADLPAGTVVLELQSPQFALRWRRLGFRLIGPAGAEVASHPTLFRAHRSGFHVRTVELRSFNVPAAGTYRLLVTGLGEEPSAKDEACRVILKRPDFAPMMVRVLGIVLGAMVFVGGLVLFLMRLVGVGERA